MPQESGTIRLSLSAPVQEKMIAVIGDRQTPLQVIFHLYNGASVEGTAYDPEYVEIQKSDYKGGFSMGSIKSIQLA